MNKNTEGTKKDCEKKMTDLLIGRYLADFDLTYSDIAQAVGISTAEVGRALNRLRNEGILKTTVNFSNIPESWGDKIKLEEEVNHRLRNHVLENEVWGYFSTHVGSQCLKKDKIFIFPSRAENKEKTLNVRLTAWLAGQQLLQYLQQKPDATIGLSWGFTIKQVVKAIEEQIKQCRKKSPVGSGKKKGHSRPLVFNIAGDITPPVPHGEKESSDHESERTRNRRTMALWSSHMAWELSEIIDGDSVQFTAPGWVPLKPKDREETVLQRLKQTEEVLNQYEGYQKIFNHGYLENADVLITSLGRKDSYRDLFKETDRQGKYVDEVLERIVADYSGAPLIETGIDLSPAGRIVAQTFIGARAEHFQEVAAAAHNCESRIGVMLVAESAEKALGVIAAVKAGLVNALVVDSNLASKIVELKPN